MEASKMKPKFEIITFFMLLIISALRIDAAPTKSAMQQPDVQLAQAGSFPLNNLRRQQQQQQQILAFGPEMAALMQVVANSRQQNRFQRSLSNSQPLSDEEQVLKRQLPELIAQAHNDKTLERTLLRMLINDSLKLMYNNNNFGNQDGSPMPDGSMADEYLLNELDNYANQQDGGGSGQTSSLNKRGNFPCGFNAVSCNRAAQMMRKIQ